MSAKDVILTMAEKGGRKWRIDLSSLIYNAYTWNSSSLQGHLLIIDLNPTLILETITSKMFLNLNKRNSL